MSDDQRSTTNPGPWAWTANDLSAFMIQPGIGTHCEHALASLLAFNGLRVSETLSADIADLGFERTVYR